MISNIFEILEQKNDSKVDSTVGVAVLSFGGGNPRLPRPRAPATLAPGRGRCALLCRRRRPAKKQRVLAVRERRRGSCQEVDVGSISLCGQGKRETAPDEDGVRWGCCFDTEAGEPE